MYLFLNNLLVGKTKNTVLHLTEEFAGANFILHKKGVPKGNALYYLYWLAWLKLISIIFNQPIGNAPSGFFHIDARNVCKLFYCRIQFFQFLGFSE